MNPKCYSDWKFGAIQIELTTLTLRITEDSALQLVNCLQLTMICMIKMLRDGEYILCFACTFRDVNTIDGILTWAKVTLIKKQEGMYKKSLLYVGSTVGSKNISNNQFYSLSWNKLILHHKYGGGGRI